MRATKQLEGQTPLHFYYNPGGQLVNTTQGSTMSLYLTRGHRFLINTPSDLVTNSQFLLSDGKDSTMSLNTLTGKWQSRFLTPYGQQQNLNGSSSAPATTKAIEPNPFIYGPSYYDSESGLYYMQARYYSSALRQFTSRDTKVLMNRYAYGNGNPVMNVDPTGHNAAGILVGIGTGILSAVAIVASLGTATTPVIVGATAAEAAKLGGVTTTASIIARMAIVGGAVGIGSSATKIAANSLPATAANKRTISALNGASLISGGVAAALNLPALIQGGGKLLYRFSAWINRPPLTGEQMLQSLYRDSTFLDEPSSDGAEANNGLLSGNVRPAAPTTAAPSLPAGLRSNFTPTTDVLNLLRDGARAEEKAASMLRLPSSIADAETVGNVEERAAQLSDDEVGVKRKNRPIGSFFKIRFA